MMSCEIDIGLFIPRYYVSLCSSPLGTNGDNKQVNSLIKAACEKAATAARRPFAAPAQA